MGASAAVGSCWVGADGPSAVAPAARSSEFGAVFAIDCVDLEDCSTRSGADGGAADFDRTQPTPPKPEIMMRRER